MDFINFVDTEEIQAMNEYASYTKTKFACEDNGISYSIKHQQSIQAIDSYKERPEIIKLLLASGSVYEELDYIYLQDFDEWVCSMKFEDTKTMVLISDDTFTFKYL
tara:strand:+ start:677 stop:994 length:318 start_codon:yes stop_codon:yes gene_type:complete